MSGKTRSLYGTALRHFINSLRPRKVEGVLVGDDIKGNKYYEIPAGELNYYHYFLKLLVICKFYVFIYLY